MAQLYFRYGAMNSGKTIEILKVAHNYEEQGKHVIIMTSGLDNRDGLGKVSSRIGMKRDAQPIFPETDIYSEISRNVKNISAILVDEAQFLTRDNVLQLTKIVDQLHIPVLAFGLKNDFQNHLFEGSEALLLFADKIEEIKTICWFCGRKATMNLRVNDNGPVYEGEQVQIGGNESYYPVCREHYFHPLLNK
ncbi:thymidine kinase [Weissella beninensis]|uniref:Thymidine kinase n=1 Tax=Periweissella beninensis TaxID=504936 RepID=A0ABT0VG18_9LACO|nr:thymidine kinase [Periweissella beninensis]MBM7543657.1 thymidine kinase [Periweissella beninensis]MCM2436636.1 thymidine kinase [Periweissella beninensis]